MNVQYRQDELAQLQASEVLQTDLLQELPGKPSESEVLGLGRARGPMIESFLPGPDVDQGFYYYDRVFASLEFRIWGFGLRTSDLERNV